MKTTNTAPWMCVQCGYMMNAASPAFDDDTEPGQGDLSICLNCGHVYTLDGERWRTLTDAEFAALDQDERKQLTMVKAALTAANLPDLTKRGGRA